jgi:hypothetical protein
MQEEMAMRKPKKKETPIWEKELLTMSEANIYSGIGMNKLLELTESRGCKFVVWNGRTRIIIRERLDEFIDKAYSI